jgi:hypothetical protein
MKILELLKKQREFFIRLADRTKLITNPLLYYSFEDELLKEQRKIGLENKKRLGLKKFPNECGIKIRPI